MKKCVVYTTIFTSDSNTTKGKLHEYTHEKNNVDYIAFTNSKHINSEFWDVIFVDDINVENSPRDSRYESRRKKILSHEYFPDYEYSVWIDNNLPICKDCNGKRYDILSIVNSYLDGYDLAVHRHPGRDCIYDEADACIRLSLDCPSKIEEQKKYYLGVGYPKNFGLYETGILMRRNCNSVTEFNNKWWDEINKFSVRDQISFPFVISQCKDLKFNPIPHTFRDSGRRLFPRTSFFDYRNKRMILHKQVDR